MVLLCLALAKDESKLVISGCPVLLPCELVTDGVEATIDDNGLVLASSEEAGEEREAFPASGVLVLLCLALAIVESMLVINECSALWLPAGTVEAAVVALPDTACVLAKSDEPCAASVELPTKEGSGRDWVALPGADSVLLMLE